MSPRLPRKKTLAIFSVFILASVLFAGYYLWGAPLDVSKYRGMVISRIEDVTGASLDTGRVTLRILPSPYIEVSDVLLSAGEEKVLEAKTMKLHISILPFFMRRIVIDHLTLEGWDLGVRRRVDGTMALREIYERIIKRRHIVRVKSMLLEGGMLSIEDRMKGRGLRLNARVKMGRVEREGGRLRFQADLGLGDGIRVFVRARAEKSGGAVALKGSAVVANMDLARLSEYVKRPVLSGRASGDLSFRYDGTLDMKGILNYRDVTMAEPSLSARPLHSSEGKAGFSLTLHGKDLSLMVKKASFEMDDYVVSGSMTMAGNTASPADLSIDLALESTPIPIGDVKSLVMDRVFRDKKLAWINEVTPLGGAVSVKSFRLKTTAGDLGEKEALTRPGAMRLEAGLEGLRFRHRILGDEEVSDLYGGLTITGGTIDFHGLTAKVGSGSIKKLSYRMEDLHSPKKHASYDLSLLGRMDAGRAIALTIRLFRDSGESVKRQLRRISATGDTRVKFNLKGRIGVKDSAWFSVNLGLKKATFRYEGFPLSFTSMDGNIDIDNHRFTFTDLVMRDSAESSFRINGYVRDFARPDPFFSLEARGGIYGGSLSAFTTGTALEGLVTEDAAAFTASIKGRKKALKVSVEGDFKDTGVEYGKLFKKSQGVPLTLNAGLVLGKETVEVKKATLKGNGTRLSMKGTFTRGDAHGPFHMFIESKKARLYDLAHFTPLVTGQADTAGTLNIILKVSRGRRERRPMYSGIISLENGHFSTPLAKEPVKSLDLFLNFKDDTAKLRIPLARIGGSDLQGSLEISSISGRKIRLNLTSNMLDTSDIWGKGSEGLLRWHEKIKALGGVAKAGGRPLTGTGKIGVAEGRVMGEEVRDFKGVVLMSPQFVRIDPLVFIAEGGTVQGMVVLFRDETSPRIFKGSAGITGLHIKEILTRLGAKKDILTGDLNGHVSLGCDRGVTPFVRCLNGKVYVKAERGRMWKFQVIGKIFSIVNIISIDELFKKGLPYRSISGDLAVKDGIISTDDLLFDSDSMRMSAVMSIDGARGTIDATLGVHPFVTIDKVVTKIPLVGWIIGGKEKSSVSLYYRIKGPVKKPSVEPARIKNIQKGIIGKMERLITSPIKIIEMGTDMLGNKDKGVGDEE